MHVLRSGKFGRIYFAALLLALHYASTIYIGSTFLSQFFPEKTLGFLYVAGALITILILGSCTRLVRQFGNYTLTLAGVSIEIAALFALTLSRDLGIIAVSFIVLQSLPAFLIFNLDIFLERKMQREGSTGKIRSTYLTVINSAFVISPIIVGSMIENGGYAVVYASAAIIMTIFFVVVFDFFDPTIIHSFREVSFRDSVRKFSIRPALASVYSINFLLQIFYALMVIYTPLYLHNTLGIGWETLGVIFTIMLLPFVIFEAPLGRIFDKYRGERDAMIAGFLIMSAAVITMSYVHSTSALLWGFLLFMSRVGASFVEIGSEFSFFRQVDSRDAGLISVFRTTSPLSYVLAPIIGFIVTINFPLVYIFPVIGAAMLLGAGLSYRLHGAK